VRRFAGIRILKSIPETLHVPYMTLSPAPDSERHLHARIRTRRDWAPMAVEVPEPHAELGAFLKTLRCRIPPESVRIGLWERLPTRRGRRVTQEEVAEAVGVSRNWYRRLEAGSVRASMKLLARLASTFAFTHEERTKLFILAIPEIGAPLQNSSRPETMMYR
jgi:DNA-binding XRE family transcriptional regulator